MGGIASLPGIKSRLLSELKYLVKMPKYKDKLFMNEFKIHQSPSHENYTAWLGGESSKYNLEFRLKKKKTIFSERFVFRFFGWSHRNGQHERGH